MKKFCKFTRSKDGLMLITGSYYRIISALSQKFKGQNIGLTFYTLKNPVYKAIRVFISGKACRKLHCTLSASRINRNPVITISVSAIYFFDTFNPLISMKRGSVFEKRDA